MTTDWTYTALTAIQGIIETVNISTPIVQQIERVYTYRSGKEADYPCVILSNPPGKRTLRGPSGYRQKLYDVELELAVKDADLDRAAAILDAYEEAIIDAFDAAVTLGLGSGYHVVSGPDWQPAREGPAPGSGVPVTSAWGMLTVKMVDAKNYSA